MKRIFVVGATSAIAEAVARLYAAERDRLFLVARNEEKLAAVAADLRVRGAEAVETHVWDAHDAGAVPEVIAAAQRCLARIDVVLVAYGGLPDQRACERSAPAARAALETNLVSVVGFLTPLADVLEAQGSGTLAVISSVAGDRGRQSNYVYGAAKAGLSTFLAGLRNRLFRAGVAVVTIKPGFVDTPMTVHVEKKGLLWAMPERVARGIHRAIRRRKPVAYVPWFWRPIMACVRAVPEPLFKRMRM